MASPFFDAIKAGVSGTPGTGAITIGTVTSGFRAFSSVPNNVAVDYRVEDGSAWEIGSGLWNGTTLARGLKYSSTGTLLSLTSAAVVSLIISADEIQPHIGGGKWGHVTAIPNSTTLTSTGIGAVTISGTATAVAPAYGSTYLASQHRLKYMSATTAGAQAGYAATAASAAISATAMLGGFEFVARWGLSTVPTGPRLLVGLATSPDLSSDPSTLNHTAMFAKNVADTNIQFMSGGFNPASKVDTGMALVANAFYETSIWAAAGERKLSWAICRLDTGATVYGIVTATASIPVNDAAMFPAVLGGVGTTTGTALTLDFQSLYLRTSF